MKNSSYKIARSSTYCEMTEEQKTYAFLELERTVVKNEKIIEMFEGHFSPGAGTLFSISFQFQL